MKAGVYFESLLFGFHEMSPHASLLPLVVRKNVDVLNTSLFLAL